MVLFGGKMKSPRFSSARFAHSTVPEHFTLVLPSLSKNLRKLLKICQYVFNSNLSRDIIPVSSEEAVLNFDYSGTWNRWFEFVAGSCLCSKSSFTIRLAASKLNDSPTETHRANCPNYWGVCITEVGTAGNMVTLGTREYSNIGRYLAFK